MFGDVSMILSKIPPRNLSVQGESIVDDSLALRVAELFGVLGDASRVKIISALRGGPQNVNTLADLVGISPSAVSHHMRSLRQLRLVRPHKQGRQVFYSLDDEHVADVLQQMLEHVIHG
jgi:ArsR family transcriptional regulator